MEWFHQFIQWIVTISILMWRTVSRPFKSSSPDLPTLASEPSTPSFIQSYEQYLADNAIKVFQWECGLPRASQIARNRLALQQERGESPAPAGLEVPISASATDPSPGDSVLSNVNGGLISTPRPDSVSVCSSAPSSPTPSLATPRDGLCSTYDRMAHPTLPTLAARAYEEHEKVPVKKDPIVVAPDFRPNVSELAKRRMGTGPPAPPLMPAELLFPAIAPVVERHMDDLTQVPSPRPVSPWRIQDAAAALARFSTPELPRSSSRRRRLALAASEGTQAALQAALTAHDPASSPFSTHAPSFFVVDDCADARPSVDINNVDIYGASESFDDFPASEQRRKGMHLITSSPIPTLVYYGIESEAAFNHESLPELGRKPFETSFAYEKKPRPATPIFDLPTEDEEDEEDITNALVDGMFSRSCISPALGSAPPQADDFDTSSAHLCSLEEGRPQALPSGYTSTSSSIDDEETMSRIVLHDALIFPFSLEDSVNFGDLGDLLWSVEDAEMASDASMTASLIFPFSSEDSVHVDDLGDPPCTVEASEAASDVHMPASPRVSTGDLTVCADAVPSSPVEEPVAFVDASFGRTSKNRGLAQVLGVFPAQEGIYGAVPSLGDVSISLPTSTVEEIVSCQPPASVATSNRKRNRAVTIMQPLALASALHPDMLTVTTVPAQDVATVSDNRASWVDFSESAAISPLSEPSSSFNEASEVFSPVTEDSGFDDSRQTFHKDRNDVDLGVGPGLQDEQIDEISVDYARPRRMPFFGGIPYKKDTNSLASPTSTPTKDSSISRIEAIERLKAYVASSRGTPARRISAIRPLVLPNRLARRDGNSSFSAGIRPTVNVAPLADCDISCRSSIGPPPSMPLPELPATASPSSSFMSRSSSSKKSSRPVPICIPKAGPSETQKVTAEEKLTALMKLFAAIDIVEGSEPTSPVAPSSASTSPRSDQSWDEDTAANESVSWGIAL